MTGPLGMGTSQSPPTPMKGHCRKNRARLRTLDQLLLQDLSSQRCGSRRGGLRRISPSCGASASSRAVKLLALLNDLMAIRAHVEMCPAADAEDGLASGV